MATVNELRARRSTAWEQAKAFLDAHRNESGILSAEDEAIFDKMESEITALGKEIERAERMEALDMELKKPTSTPLTTRPEKSKLVTNLRATDEYKKAFWDVVKNPYSVARNVLTTGTDDGGAGYLIPDSFEKQLIQALYEDNVVRKNAHVITTSSGTHQIPVVSTTGVANWTDELGTFAESESTFGQKLLGAHKLTAICKVSDELLNDSAFNLESYFKDEFARRFNAAEEQAFLLGTSEHQPTGILTQADTGVTTATETITADEILDLFYSLKAPYRKKAVFIMNDATVKLIRQIKDSNGQYIYAPGLKEGEQDTILGHKIYTSPYMPTVESGANAILFADMSYYWIADRQQITFKRLNERYAETGQVGFIASKRVDATLVLNEAAKVLKIK